MEYEYFYSMLPAELHEVKYQVVVGHGAPALHAGEPASRTVINVVVLQRSVQVCHVEGVYPTVPFVGF
jgi:hypothetical protein